MPVRRPASLMVAGEMTRKFGTLTSSSGLISRALRRRVLGRCRNPSGLKEQNRVNSHPQRAAAIVQAHVPWRDPVLSQVFEGRRAKRRRGRPISSARQGGRPASQQFVRKTPRERLSLSRKWGHKPRSRCVRLCRSDRSHPRTPELGAACPTTRSWFPGMSQSRRRAL
jgi:hypothetical protein